MALFRRRRSGEAPAGDAAADTSSAAGSSKLTASVRDFGARDDGRVGGDDDMLLDLREPLPQGTLAWGMPTRCPRCDDWGYIDHLDLVERAMRLHCPTCHFHWEITEAQIEAANRRRDSQAQA